MMRKNAKPKTLWPVALPPCEDGFFSLVDDAIFNHVVVLVGWTDKESRSFSFVERVRDQKNIIIRRLPSTTHTHHPNYNTTYKAAVFVCIFRTVKLSLAFGHWTKNYYYCTAIYRSLVFRTHGIRTNVWPGEAAHASYYHCGLTLFSNFLAIKWSKNGRNVKK